MHGKKPLMLNKPAGPWWRTAGQRCAKQWQARPWRFTFRLLVLTVLLTIMFVQWATTGQSNPWLLAFSATYLALAIYQMVRPLSVKGEQVHQWAIEEQEHITIASLTGKTPEELEKLLEYHMKYGHVEEADRISQKLLAMVEDPNPSDPQTAQAGGAAPQPRADADTKEGLPSWMKNDDKQESSEQPVKQKLPDWMN